MLDRNRHGGGVLLHITEALSYSVTFIGLDNMELPQHNGSSNCFCLWTLYSPPSTIHLVLKQLFRNINPLSTQILYSFVTLMYRFSIAAQRHINLCRIFCQVSIWHRFCDNQLQWHNVEPLVLFIWSWCRIPACYDLVFTNCPPQMTTMCVGLTITKESVIHTAHV